MLVRDFVALKFEITTHPLQATTMHPRHAYMHGCVCKFVYIACQQCTDDAKVLMHCIVLKLELLLCVNRWSRHSKMELS